ncbi:hypothetical protein PsorP6_014879 [Peronosclerospora sorghi]|uniref:Uncharacterized protein n=1 Tax=Peronosclerospora sorghi TaxID=230839 RepID=A0ACC0VRT3_9STRA|nr:hypothetical protein PsorP6_014879 [Peronosclerospora sorghi]
MTDLLRTILQPSGPPAPPSSAAFVPPTHSLPRPPTSAVDPPHALVKRESPSSDTEPHHAQKAVRLARVHARRDKRKPLEAADALDATASKKMKTEAAAVVGGDPSADERLRAMEAQLEHLDPDSKEAKKKRRLIRNRMSAQLHRERKKAYVGQLEDQLQAKEMQLKALQEQVAAMAVESAQLKQQLGQRTRDHDDEPVAIKAEPVLVEKAEALDASDAPAQDWAACLGDLEDAIVGEDLLCDLDESPLAAYGLRSMHDDPVALAVAEAAQRQKLQAQAPPEIHAAKKNLAMMMAMMFSVTFCGQGESLATGTSGSTLSSMFTATPVQELSQMSIASRIVACLEQTSWEDFQDVSSWTASAASAAAAAAVAVSTDKKTRSRKSAAHSPSAASDVTDSGSACGSPKDLAATTMSFDTDLIEEFVYPVDEPFAPAVADTHWFGERDDGARKSETKTTVTPVSMTSRLYEQLTRLWTEKNQVLLTVRNGKNEVTRRSVADMSTIRRGMATGALFPSSSAAPGPSSSPKVLEPHDQSVTFLYPLSAFSEDQRSAAYPHGAPSDQVFLEVSCQLQGAAAVGRRRWSSTASPSDVEL